VTADRTEPSREDRIRAAQDLPNEPLTNGPDLPLVRLPRVAIRCPEQMEREVALLKSLQLRSDGFTSEEAKPVFQDEHLLFIFEKELRLLKARIQTYKKALGLVGNKRLKLTCDGCAAAFDENAVFPCCDGCTLQCQQCWMKPPSRFCAACFRLLEIYNFERLVLTPMCHNCEKTKEPCKGSCSAIVCKNSIAYETACAKPMCQPCAIQQNICNCKTCEI